MRVISAKRKRHVLAIVKRLSNVSIHASAIPCRLGDLGLVSWALHKMRKADTRRVIRDVFIFSQSAHLQQDRATLLCVGHARQRVKNAEPQARRLLFCNPSADSETAHNLQSLCKPLLALSFNEGTNWHRRVKTKPQRTGLLNLYTAKLQFRWRSKKEKLANIPFHLNK
jgi:hypothetical protein